MSEISHPLQKEESNSEDSMTKLANMMVELAKSRVQMAKATTEFMEEMRDHSQIQPIPLKGMKEEMTPKVTYYTQIKIKINQPL